MYTSGVASGAPLIRQVIPGYARPGQVVAIFGRGFGPTKGLLSLNGTSISEVMFWQDTRIQFRLPPTASIGNLLVNNAGRRSNSWEFPVLPAPGQVLPQSGERSAYTRVLFTTQSDFSSVLAGDQLVRNITRIQLGRFASLVYCEIPPGTGTVAVTAYVYDFSVNRNVPKQVGTFTYR